MLFLITVILLNMLSWSIFMLGIKIRTVLTTELNGLHKNVQHFRHFCCIGSPEITKKQKRRQFWHPVYKNIYTIHLNPLKNIYVDYHPSGACGPLHDGINDLIEVTTKNNKNRHLADWWTFYVEVRFLAHMPKNLKISIIFPPIFGIRT